MIIVSIILKITVFCLIPPFFVIVRTTPKKIPILNHMIPGIKNRDQVSNKLWMKRVLYAQILGATVLIKFSIKLPPLLPL